ncbi:UPF0228 family protein [Methanosarcina mazei]|uniref:UPF0228 family protein n=1 Tax=Methanosarcina mazei TaxID=2209 RepID=UPI0009B5C447
MIEKNDLQVKNSVLCFVYFVNGSSDPSKQRSWISKSDATRVKNDLEANEKVLTVGIGYIEG